MITAPAPWDLKGYGYIIAFRFPKEFTQENSFIPTTLKERFSGGIGAVMFINYENSAVGPYKELMFIPGKFKFSKKNKYSITKIYVSTNDSVVNGKKNWGIPKELADFSFEKIDPKKERLIISKSNKPFMDITLQTRGPGIPVFTKLWPISLGQETKDKTFYTHFHGKGKEKLVKILDVSVNQKYFPDISEIKPLFAIKVENFELVFEKPEIVRREK